MSDLTDLYQEILLDHNSKPRNFRKVEDANRSADGYNPLCGDQITLYLKLEDDVIADVGFQGHGCAISKASASMLTQSIKGKSVDDAKAVFNEFHKMLTETGAELDYDLLDDLEMLSGVSEYPVRIKCAVLCWHTLQAALANGDEAVSTE